MRVFWKNGITNLRKYYVCTARLLGIIGKDKCELGFLNAHAVEKAVWNKVQSWIKNPDELEEEIKNGMPNDIEDKVTMK